MDKISEFLKRKTGRFLSIDFGRWAVKAVYLECQGANFQVLNYGLKKLSLAPHPQEEIPDFIKAFSKDNSIAARDVYLTISDPESIIIKHLILPALPKEEILEAAKWQVKEEIPFALEQGLFDWQMVEEYTDADGAKKNQIAIIAAKREVIWQYLSIIGACNLNPVLISSSPFNYANILKNLEDKFPFEAVLDISHNDAFLSIFHNYKLTFIRRLSFSGDKLTRALAEILAPDQGEAELPLEKAEEIRNAFGIPGDSGAVLNAAIPAIQVISLMRPLLEVLTREIKASFDYFATDSSAGGPGVLYITGGGANLKNLDTYLGKELNINVASLPLPKCIKSGLIPGEKLARDKNQIISALAAALADTDALNLIPPEVKSRKVEAIQKVSLRLVAISVGATLLFLFSVAQLQIRDYRNRLKQSRAQWEAMKAIKSMKEQVGLRDGLINKIQNNTLPVDGLLKVISNAMPSTMILDELSLQGSAHTLNLKGIVSAGGDVAESILTNFMGKLEASPFFKDTSLVSSDRLGTVQAFQIKCDLNR